MGQISMATRDELVGALAARYGASNRVERGSILDEFVAVSGLHRKHALRQLRAGLPNQRSGPPACLPAGVGRPFASPRCVNYG